MDRGQGAETGQEHRGQMTALLTQSRWCRGLQCPRMLWLLDHKPELFDDSVLFPGAPAITREVKQTAEGLFDNIVRVSGDEQQRAEATQKLLIDGAAVIADASFLYGDCFCSVDFLINHGEEGVDILNVKSATGVRDVYFDELAFACYVLEHCGRKIRRAKLAYLNNQYVRKGRLDPEKLFRIEDHTRHVTGRLARAEEETGRILAGLKQNTMPQQEISARCRAPYNCGFFSFCTEGLPSPSVFDLTGTSLKDKLELYHEGIRSFEELSRCERLSPAQKQQVRHALQDISPDIKREEIRAFLSGLQLPLYFLDFEAFSPAIPMFAETRPYAPVVFQYSLHILRHCGAQPEHREYLAQPHGDPRRKLAEALVRDIPKDVTIVVYDASYEKNRIRELAALYPDLGDHLLNMSSHIADLMVPFARRMYYTRAMEGSASIKKVLPAMFPEEPDLDYRNLAEVHEGAEASWLFQNMASMDEGESARARDALLKYCGLDTYAMVRIYEKLLSVIGDADMGGR